MKSSVFHFCQTKHSTEVLNKSRDSLMIASIYIHSSISFEKYDSTGTKFLPGVEALCPHFTACPPTYLYVPSQGTVVYECMIINLSHGIGID